jgi:hypothetical protein
MAIQTVRKDCSTSISVRSISSYSGLQGILYIYPRLIAYGILAVVIVSSLFIRMYHNEYYLIVSKEKIRIIPQADCLGVNRRRATGMTREFIQCRVPRMHALALKPLPLSSSEFRRRVV